MSDPETELAEYIAKCRAMHRNQVGKTPRFAHAVAALAEQLDHARVELAEAARLLKDAAPPWAGMTAAEAALIWEWSAARRKFVDDVTGPACARS